MPLSVRNFKNDLAERNSGIDLLRGIAITLVVIHHVALRIPLAQTSLADVLPIRVLKALNRDGQNAVTVFFVISGFLITSHALKRWGTLSHLDWRSFYRRRAARIVPCLTVLVILLSVLDIIQVPNYTIVHANQSLPRAILSAFGMHLNWYEGQTGYLPGGWDVLWSLSIEEAFYIGFPILCLLTAVSSPLRTFLFICLAFSVPFSLAALSSAPEVWQEKAYLPGMSAIAMGVCAALIAQSAPPDRRNTWRVGCGITGSVFVATFLVNSPFYWRHLDNSAPLVLSVSTSLVLIAFSWKWGARYTARGTSWVRAYGFLSYEIYLSHMFVVFPLIALFHASGSDLRSGWLWFLPAWCLSGILGYAVYYFLSRPAEHWIHTRPRAQLINQNAG